MRKSLLRWAVFIVALNACGCATNRPATVAVSPTSIAAPAATTDSDSVDANAPFFERQLRKFAPTPVPTPYRAPAPQVRAVEFSPDRKWLAVGTLQPSGTATGTITVRDCASNRVIKTWKVPGGVRFLAFSPDGKNVAAIGTDDTILVWNWKAGQLLHSSQVEVYENASDRTPLAYSPNGRTLAIVAKNIQLFDTKTWESRRLNPHPVDIEMSNYVTFSPDGRHLLVSNGFEGYAGYTSCLVSDGKARQKTNFMPYSAPVFARDGRQFAGNGNDIGDGNVAGAGDGAFIFDARTVKIKRKLTDDFTPLAFSPDAKLLAGIALTTGDPGDVQVWNIRTRKLARQFSASARAVVWLDAKTLLAGDENGVRKLRVARS